MSQTQQIPESQTKQVPESQTKQISENQTKQISDSLDTCQHYINQFLKHAYTLDIQQLNENERLMILSFYGELLALLYDNCNLFNVEL